MIDETEDYRRARVAQLNDEASERAKLEAKYGRVWNTDELTAEFEVVGFLAPFCVVKRRDNGEKGSVEFQHRPRFYFNYVAD